ncbi:unnamed protein product, partial [Mesorhabditis spiculigera]
MVFIGRDWRAPGETWIRTPQTNGWERSRLRPLQIACEAIPVPGSGGLDELCHTPSSASLQSVDSTTSSSSNSRDSLSDEGASELDECWVPHCHIKSKTKEFVGVTSMSDAFHNLDMARGVYDLKRFAYITKTCQILIDEKLQNLSATARKTLLQILTAIVLRAVDNDFHQETARELVSNFGSQLEGTVCMHHVCGSPSLVSKHRQSATGLLDFVSNQCPRTPADSDETTITFLDLPREVLSLVLRKLPDHTSVLETAKAHEALESLVESEGRLWESLARFHFAPHHIDKEKSGRTWREAYFYLKRHHGVKEFYADMIHLCCHCRCLFWRSLGHPCVSQNAPSVRVTPQQFVDMLLFL